MITDKQLKALWRDFFTKHGFKQIQNSSVIPENDPTVLFTTAGMHPLVPYLLGEKHPQGNRLFNVQRCIRTGDIDSVGDYNHNTFFEMLGNWFVGSCPKEDMINKLAYVLEVSPDALTIPEIDSYIGLMHTLFAIEDLHGIKIDKISDEVCIRLDKSNLSKYIHMDDLLRSWYKEYEKYQNGEITKEEYDHWRYTYPKVKAECTKANLDKLREQNKNK